jgi:hypothetical protein
MSHHAAARFAERFPGCDLETYLSHLGPLPAKEKRHMRKRHRVKARGSRGFYSALDAVFVIDREAQIVTTVLYRTAKGAGVRAPQGRRKRRKARR